ncbi:DUF5655 domain-containing protein [Neptunicella sp. SCSIO 80796]|uniref:DUF5655 domain-containing protein n=1 Tax=Neptunicella plasticusilytica TaxID=3117012 RepID=UPI003A4DA263
MTNPDQMLAAVASSLQQRTGKSLQQWVDLVEQSAIDPLNQNEVRRWLKQQHGIAQNSQWAIADAAARAAGWQPPTLEEYISQQYAGAKAPLLVIFQHLRQRIMTLGADVQIEGRASYIPFIRKRQFTAIAAATKNRVDVGLRFTDAPQSHLLQAANGPGQATHKISLTDVEQVSDEVETLLVAAYQQNG